MPVYQDGTFPSGSPTLTTLAGVSFKCNSFTVSKPATTVPIVDENGAASGALVFADARTFTAELQFSANTIAEPTTAAANATQGVFANVNIDGANVNCFVTSVTVNKPQRGPWTATVNGQARIN
jgi:hypothetical protein